MTPKKVITIMIPIFVVSFLYMTCEKSPTQSDENRDVIDVSYFTVQNYPRVDGSTSAHPLQIVVACAILDVPYDWMIWMDETRRAYATGSNASLKNYINGINHSGTHGSYVNLLVDSTDFIIVAREPSIDELTLADSLGVTLTTQEIALDAFVFILNTENPVYDLTAEQTLMKPALPIPCGNGFKQRGDRASSDKTDTFPYTRTNDSLKNVIELRKNTTS